MIEQWRYKYAGGTYSIWYDGSTLPNTQNLHNSPTVVGLDWQHNHNPCEEWSPFEVEGDALKCEHNGCHGRHWAFYEVPQTGVLIEVSWTTPKDPEE